MSQTLITPTTATLRRTGGMKLMFASLLVAASAAFAVSASAQPGPHGHGGHGWHGAHAGPGKMWGPMAGGRGMDRLLTDVGASDEQKQQIRQIMKDAFKDLRAQREQNRALRERAMEVFTAPNVDANAAEAVRQQMLQQHDQASRRMTQAMLDASRVLTPEQRTQIAERIKQRKEQARERMQRRAERRGAAASQPQ